MSSPDYLPCIRCGTTARVTAPVAWVGIVCESCYPNDTDGDDEEERVGSGWSPSSDGDPLHDDFLREVETEILARLVQKEKLDG